MPSSKELVAIFDILLSPLVLGLGLTLPSAVLIIAVSARSACACSTKEAAYRTAMRADLRNLVEAQEAYYEAHGSYAVSLSPAEHRWSTGVVPVSMRTGPSGFTAVVAYPRGTELRCRLAYSRNRSPTTICEPPNRGRRWR